MVGLVSSGVDPEEVKTKKKHKGHDSRVSTDLEPLCVECFKFLKALAKNYVEVQERYTCFTV